MAPVIPAHKDLAARRAAVRQKPGRRAPVTVHANSQWKSITTALFIRHGDDLRVDARLSLSPCHKHSIRVAFVDRNGGARDDVAIVAAVEAGDEIVQDVGAEISIEVTDYVGTRLSPGEKLWSQTIRT